MPHLEKHEIQLIGESPREAWSRVITQRPRIRHLTVALDVDALDATATRELAEAWAQRAEAREERPVASAELIAEAMNLAAQQFPDRAEPGRSLRLLQETLRAARQCDPPSLPLTRQQVLTTLSLQSGLPLDILDGGAKLDLADVRAFFTRRVIGQDEAVDALVDRISMLKAGLTDPQRPLGVFLFAGPTGTGTQPHRAAMPRLHAMRRLRHAASVDGRLRCLEEGAGGGDLGDARAGTAGEDRRSSAPHPANVVVPSSPRHKEK